MSSFILLFTGRILTQSPLDVWKNKLRGTFSDVPVVIGK